MPTSDKNIQKLRDNKVIVDLPQAYEDVLRDADLGKAEIELLISLSQDLLSVEDEAGKPVSSCFIL